MNMESAKKEIRAVAGPNEFAEFYSRLKVLKDIHRKNPNETARPLTIEFQEMANFVQDPDRIEKEIVRFTDEEGYGKFLDMHLLFEQYLNLKGIARIDYISYLSIFDHFFDIPKEVEEADNDFELKWAQEQVPAGPKRKLVEELEALGMDRLKSALMAANLKCGGTLKERANRLFSTKGNNLKEERRRAYLAQTECRILKLTEYLGEERAATKENVERKQARASGRQQCALQSEKSSACWDGKPIPYWLYKLHGLNIGYSCEICGNQVYKGPKTFQRHFTEWRHSHGMRCLGIPNTAHFANITKIHEAIELWKKMCEEKKYARWNPEADEEFEDSLGNVVNAATFRDLKRQGLL
uniref:Matrin-type domain-containing protein n=1 Tax=Ditylenchus dipsaci TaxID=166011 RepID=A0A915ESP9_9BILA